MNDIGDPDASSLRTRLVGTHRKRRVWRTGVVVVPVAGLLAWLGFTLGVGTPNPPTTAALELRSAAPARPAPCREAVVASLPAVGANGATVPAPRGADEVEVCSVGTFQIKMRPDGMPDDDPLGDSKARLDAALASARERAFAALRADRSEQGRAAVLALDLAAAQRKRLGRFEASGCRTSQCLAAFHAAPDPTRDALYGDLARMAAATRDPAVYALAIQACRASTDGPSACRLVSAARWAQLDKGNASPWLSLLSDATQSGDAAAASEALHRMATAQRSDARHFAVSGWIVARIPREVGLELGTWLLATEAFSAGTSPGYSPLGCKVGQNSSNNSKRNFGRITASCDIRD